MRYKLITRKTVWGAGLFPPWWDKENSQAIEYVFRYGHCIITVRGAAKICGFLRSSASINLPPKLPGTLYHWQQTSISHKVMSSTKTQNVNHFSVLLLRLPVVLLEIRGFFYRQLLLHWTSNYFQINASLIGT